LVPHGHILRTKYSPLSSPRNEKEGAKRAIFREWAVARKQEMKESRGIKRGILLLGLIILFRRYERGIIFSIEK